MSRESSPKKARSGDNEDVFVINSSEFFLETSPALPQTLHVASPARNNTGFIGGALETPPKQPQPEPQPMSSTTRFALLENGRPIRQTTLVFAETPGSGSDSATSKMSRVRRRGDSIFLGTPKREEPRQYSEIPFVETFALLMKTLSEGPGKINGEMTLADLYKNELFRDLFELRKRFKALSHPNAATLVQRIKTFITQYKDQAISCTETRRAAHKLYFSLLFQHAAENIKPTLRSLEETFEAAEQSLSFPEFRELNYAVLSAEEYEGAEEPLKARLDTIRALLPNNKELRELFENAADALWPRLDEELLALTEKLSALINAVNQQILAMNTSLGCEKPFLLPLAEKCSPRAYIDIVSKKIEHIKTYINDCKKEKTKQENGGTSAFDKLILDGSILLAKGFRKLLKSFLGDFRQLVTHAQNIRERLSDEFVPLLQEPLINFLNHLLSQMHQQKVLLLPDIRKALLHSTFFTYLKTYGIIPQNTDLEYFSREKCDAEEIYVAYAAFRLCPDLPKPKVVAQQVQTAQQMGSPVFTTPIRKFVQTMHEFEEEMLETRFDEIYHLFLGGVLQMKERYDQTHIAPESFNAFVTDIIAQLEALLKDIPKGSEDLAEAIRKPLSSIVELQEAVKPLSAEAQLQKFHEVFSQDFEEDKKEKTAPPRNSPVRLK